MARLGRIVKFLITSIILTYFIEHYFIRDLLLQYRNIELHVSNKHVLVTGASTGIGEQIAYHYAKLGAKLVITSRRQSVLEKVAKKCRHLGSPSVSVFAADMGDPKQVDGVSEHVLRHFDGHIDHVILNHIGPFTYQFYKYEADVARSLAEINYLSYVQLASSLLPHMERTNGSLVVVSSIAGRMPAIFCVPYSASKFALEGFFGSLQQELETLKSNVSVSLIGFGLVATSNIRTATGTKIQNVNFESPAEAALQVVRVAETKAKDHFWPWWMRLIVLVHNVAPGILKITSKYNYNMTAFDDDIKLTKNVALNKRQSFYQRVTTGK